MSKFLYPIYKLKTKSYIKWWLYHKKAGGSGILSEILEGFSFNLANTLNRKFNLFEIEGNSVQDGSPSPDNEVPIESAGDNGSINEKIGNKNLAYVEVEGKFRQYADGKFFTNASYNSYIAEVEESTQYTAVSLAGATNFSNLCQFDENMNFLEGNPFTGGSTKQFTTVTNCKYITVAVRNTIEDFMVVKGTTVPNQYVPHEEQDYSIFVQQPFRSIGDVRDGFVKKSDDWYERHLPYIASYNGETLPQDVYNEVDNVKYCNEKSMSTTGQFSIGASVQYIDENNWNDLPCTEEQIQQLENLPSTYKDFTIINSEDETPAHLKIQYYKEG